MGTMTWHLSQYCGQRDKVVTKLVPSDSNPTRAYTTSVFGPMGSADCTCPGWKFHGKCKHVESVRAEMCDWDSEHDAEGQTLQQNVNCVCPRCGSETELQKVAV
jgi:hypothetical protein